MAAYTSSSYKITGQAQVFIANDKPAALQGLTRESITLVDDGYSKVTEYAIKFTPFSTSKTNPTTLQLSYPVSVSPEPADGSGGCSTRQSGKVVAQGSQCTKVEGARLMYVQDAIKPGVADAVTLTIKLKNPKDNWGRVGFKLKTYELVVDPTTKVKTEYIMNVVEGNELIPILKCLSPCQDCKQPPGTILSNPLYKSSFMMYKSYCTKCWPNGPLKYLHQVPYLKPGQTNTNALRATP